MLSMLQQQQAMMANKLLLAVPTTVPGSVKAAPTPATIASGLLTIPDVSLEDFCVQYHVDEQDKLHLENMEF